MSQRQPVVLDDVIVRELGLSEVVWSAALHRSALGAGLFPRLGVDFLARYHEVFISSPYAVALAVERCGRPVGFVVGSVDGAAHASWVVRHRGRGLACAGVRALASRPTLWGAFVRTRARRYTWAGIRLLRRSTRARPGSQPTDRRATLSHIAVEHVARGARLGTELLDAFEDAVERSGTSRAELRTSHAAGFYRARGWRAVGVETDLDGLEHEVMVRDLIAGGTRCAGGLGGHRS